MRIFIFKLQKKELRCRSKERKKKLSPVPTPNHINQKVLSLFTSETIDDGSSRLEISPNMLMPLLAGLKEENIQLEEQKNLVDNDLKALDAMTKALVTENKKLKAHYQERTSDVGKITQTIAVNTEE